MNFIPKPLIAVVGVGALASVGLFASVSPAQKPAGHQDRFISEIETVLAMTPAQKDQAQTAIREARETARPVRQELMTTNKALQSAIHSDNTAQIQELSKTEGQEIGQLLNIRSSAVAKVYNTLTPQQKTRADALHRVLMQGFQQQMSQNHSQVGS